jgi:maltose/moltooligosaccharide transporter
LKVKEFPPALYNEYHGIKEEPKKDSPNIFQLLAKAPKAFWTVGLVQFFCWAAFMYMWTYTNGAIADTCWGTTDTNSADYQAAGNWVGILFAVQAIGSVAWAAVLPWLAAKTNRKIAYSLSLVLGGVGFISTLFFHDQYLLFVSFILIGFAWAAMLAMPFTILTNALEGYGHMGSYLGLFNGTICVPQIVAALVGGALFSLVGGSQVMMLVIAGIALIIGAVCVFNIKEKKQK